MVSLRTEVVSVYGRDMAYEVGEGFRVRPRRTGRAVVLSLVAVVFVCSVAAAGLVVWNVQSMRTAAGPARQAAEAFWVDVVAGEVVGAYSRLCPATRSRWSREDFAARLAVPPRITAFVVVRVRVATEAGQQRAMVTTRLTRQSGVTGEHPLPVVGQDGRWLVCGDPL